MIAETGDEWDRLPKQAQTFMSRLVADEGMRTWPRKKQADIEMTLSCPLCLATVPGIREEQFTRAW